MTSPANMSKKGSKLRDNTNSETAGRLANWQHPDNIVGYPGGGSESPDEANLEDIAASLETASLRDEKDVKLVCYSYY